MKKAKILLSLVAFMSVAGGSLAYKANRIINLFYIDTTTFLSGQVRTVCTKQTSYLYTYEPFGTRTIKASTAPITMTCPVISVLDYA